MSLKSLIGRLCDRTVGLAGYRRILPVGKQPCPQFYAPAFERAYQRVRSKSLAPHSGLHTTYSAAEYLAKNSIPGAIVECGVFRGGTVMVALEALAEAGDVGRAVFLYDTFAGMPEPTSRDVDLFGGKIDAPAHFKRLRADNPDAQEVDWYLAPLHEVKQNLAESSYPMERIRFVKGKVEDTIPSTIPESIALLRLDMDWYEPTRYALDHLFPLVTRGGVIVVDDYGAWGGAREAVDEYFEAHPHRIFLQSDGVYGALCGTKES